ncbi:hypothetical protein LOK49_LG05G02933 [Camellia lanceoleosa]|uniref:Uncharacterized protein n=1 Tax=Camellia lanceoleosa TaxID=1840588 RepID=A0ACC0HMD1_9ERIC|nr:hypothetical protein LOK49_LG05G02933 [Camellia lanceoleosa]
MVTSNSNSASQVIGGLEVYLNQVKENARIVSSESLTAMGSVIKLDSQITQEGRDDCPTVIYGDHSAKFLGLPGNDLGTLVSSAQEMEVKMQGGTSTPVNRDPRWSDSVADGNRSKLSDLSDSLLVTKVRADLGFSDLGDQISVGDGSDRARGDCSLSPVGADLTQSAQETRGAKHNTRGGFLGRGRGAYNTSRGVRGGRGSYRQEPRSWANVASASVRFEGTAATNVIPEEANVQVTDSEVMEAAVNHITPVVAVLPTELIEIVEDEMTTKATTQVEAFHSEIHGKRSCSVQCEDPIPWRFPVPNSPISHHSHPPPPPPPSESDPLPPQTHRHSYPQPPPPELFHLAELQLTSDSDSEAVLQEFLIIMLQAVPQEWDQSLMQSLAEKFQFQHKRSPEWPCLRRFVSLKSAVASSNCSYVNDSPKSDKSTRDSGFNPEKLFSKRQASPGFLARNAIATTTHHHDASTSTSTSSSGSDILIINSNNCNTTNNNCSITNRSRFKESWLHEQLREFKHLIPIRQDKGLLSQ